MQLSEFNFRFLIPARNVYNVRDENCIIILRHEECNDDATSRGVAFDAPVFLAYFSRIVLTISPPRLFASAAKFFIRRLLLPYIPYCHSRSARTERAIAAFAFRGRVRVLSRTFVNYPIICRVMLLPQRTRERELPHTLHSYSF